MTFHGSSSGLWDAGSLAAAELSDARDEYFEVVVFLSSAPLLPPCVLALLERRCAHLLSVGFSSLSPVPVGNLNAVDLS